MSNRNGYSTTRILSKVQKIIDQQHEFKLQYYWDEFFKTPLGKMVREGGYFFYHVDEPDQIVTYAVKRQNIIDRQPVPGTEVKIWETPKNKPATMFTDIEDLEIFKPM